MKKLKLERLAIASFMTVKDGDSLRGGLGAQ